MMWAIAYFIAALLTCRLCWQRGWGYRRASLLLLANHVAQLGCQVVNGWASMSWPPMWAPVVEWIVLDMATAIAIARCPEATRTHALLATTLGCQVLIHAAFAGRGVPQHTLDLYLAIIGFGGWCQLLILSGGANYGRLARVVGAWGARRRVSRVGAFHRSRVEPGQ